MGERKTEGSSRGSTENQRKADIATMTATAKARESKAARIVRELLEDCSDSEKLRIAAFFDEQVRRQIEGPPPAPKPLPMGRR
jgi:hypothetical protein